MKIKIKYEIKDVDGVGKKSYTKTFDQVNDKASVEEFKKFTEAFLGLVKNNSHKVAYEIYKANEEKIQVGSLQ